MNTVYNRCPSYILSFTKTNNASIRVCFRYKELSGADQHAQIAQSYQCI